jgi:predicted nucleic acid-binding protein
VIVLDTSVTYALADRRDARHAEVVAWYERDRPELVTTPLVLAEVDYLIGRRLGRRAQASFWDDVAAGAYLVDWWPSAATQVAEVALRWSELDLGLTDASLVALAFRYETLALATVDHRHFRAVRSLDGGQPFRLLPTDA